jgi:hypothetical protein
MSSCRGIGRSSSFTSTTFDWRSAGMMGHGGMHFSVNDNDVGDAVHSMAGVFVYYDPAAYTAGLSMGFSLVGVVPTVLRAMDMLSWRGLPL